MDRDAVIESIILFSYFTLFQIPFILFTAYNIKHRIHHSKREVRKPALRIAALYALALLRVLVAVLNVAQIVTGVTNFAWDSSLLVLSMCLRA